MIQEIDKKIIDLHQEVYLFFYDLTGITVGMVLFVNMLVENAMFLMITTSIGIILGICSVVLIVFYYVLHALQVSERIKMYNEMALNWEQNYMLRILFCVNTLFMFVLTKDWRFALMYVPYILAMYLPAIKIRERNKERFKIVKWAMA